MTLLIAVFAAILSSIVWYTNESARKLKVGILSLMLWSASLMWFVDAVAEYMELGAAYFTPEVEDMINDGFLGLCVVALALIIWLVVLFVKDPGKVLKEAFNK